MSTIYENISELCKAMGITGAKMCKDIGVSKSLMTSLKTGRTSTINSHTAQKIADYFGVSVDELLGSAPEQTKKAPGEIAGGQSEKVVEAMKLLSTLDDQRLELALAHLRLLEKLDNE